MAEDSDSYAAARAGLRDTAKWYTASLAALGTLLAGGLSLGILPELGAADLKEGLVVGIGVLVCILLAIILVQEVLFPREFGVEELDRPEVASLLAPFLPEIMPRDIKGIADLRQKLAKETDLDELNRLRAVQTKVVSFAAFLDLRQKVRATNWLILILFTLACSGIAFLAYLKGKAEVDSEAGKTVIFAPGPGWTDLANGAARACGADAPLQATGLPDTPFAGWWQLTITAPSPCAGAVFSVPGVTVTPGR